MADAVPISEHLHVEAGLICSPRIWIMLLLCISFFFFSSRRRHTRLQGDWSSDVCSSDLSPFDRVNDGGRVVAGVHAIERRADDRRAEVALLVALPHALIEGVVQAAPGDEIGRAACRGRG